MNPAPNAPVIGITIGRLLDPNKPATFALGEAYVQAIQRAGGVPFLIPMGLTDENSRILGQMISGIVFTGGGDVSPEWYAAEPDDRIHTIDQDRDRQESILVKAAVEQQLPFFGICRGIQIINVALGGTLYADVMDDHPAALKHDFYPDWPRDHYAHPVAIQAGTPLERIFGCLKVPVNSLHHQGIRQLAPGLQAIAHSPDGLIESVSLTGHPFGLAVQWHPECLPDDPLMQALFSALINAARRG